MLEVSSPRQGFTLIELLVVIAIIAILSVLAAVGMSRAITSGHRASEINGARVLMTAFQLYGDDNKGKILPGYKNDDAFDQFGNAIGNPENARYPWRLAPYFDYKIQGAILIGKQKSLYGKYETQSALVYATSLAPSLGMNVRHVGGDYSGVSAGGVLPISRHFQKFGTFCITRMSQAPTEAQRLAVFTSARTDGSEGYFKVTPPSAGVSFERDALPSAFGNIDLRYNGEAVAGFFDGHADTLTEEDCQDMRTWSPLALDKDDPDFRTFN